LQIQQSIMSEDEVQAKLTNLENDVATLQGENDRLNSELKLRDQTIDELKDVQKSLEEQVKAAHEETRKSMEIASSSEQLEQLKADKGKQASHIIDLENKLKMYQDFESSRVAMEKQLTEIEQKSQKHLQELVEAKASHELEVKSLKEQIIKLSQDEADYNPGWAKLIDLQIVIKVSLNPRFMHIT
jgi:chromosome segregation ATPase